MQFYRLYRYGAALFLQVFGLTSCGDGQTPHAPQGSPPTIGVEITRDNCPSIEAQADTEIMWTNTDNVDRVLLIERKDELGNVVESIGTDLLQPGSTFSVGSLSPGQYTYYCSKDRVSFGSILITG